MFGNLPLKQLTLYLKTLLDRLTFNFNFSSRSKDRHSRRRSSRSRSRDRKKRSRSKEKSSSKKSSRHRSKSRDRERNERKRSRSKERNRDSRTNSSKDVRSMRERSPGHASDSRVVRDYDQEEAGFESNGDIKVRYIGNQDRGSAVVSHFKYEYLILINYFGSIRFRTILTMESQKMGNYQHYKKILEVRQWVQKIWKYQTLRSFCIK